MRKTMMVAGLAAALVAGGGSADAQTRPFTIGLAGGPSFPVGEEFGAEAGTGYHVQASVGFAPAALPVGLRADLLWQEFPDEHEGTFREIGGLANVLVGIPLPVARPYLLGGVGVVSHTPPGEDHGDHVHEHEGETSFAYALGGGIAFPFLGLTGTLEARYLAAGGEHRGVPVSVGIRF